MQSVRLLLLLFCSVYLLSPGTGFRSRRLCGVQLVEALLLVCGEKGLFYQPGRRGRDENMRVMTSDAAIPQQVMHKEQSAVSSVIKRGIVEQCCHFSCDYYDLENYCNI
ncbi:insulin [Clarias gariepinus]|uniref:insulin n=1 Tax=Clarias gariepinus TaxID=13013 RepID=UPI00234CD95C|nr:insulin [Clarias gariepinus]XP_053370895.1 insulin [Clarias gariepinus]